MAESDELEGSLGERTAADLSSLLVELSRALKALRFFPDGPAQRDVMAGAYLAWQIEIERAGPLELWVEDQCFHAARIAEAVESLHLGDLFGLITERKLERLRITQEICRESFHEFAGWLAASEVTTVPALPGIAVSLHRESSLPDQESGSPIAETTRPIAEPTGPIAEPTGPIAEPAGPIAEPTAPVTEPTGPTRATTHPVAESVSPGGAPVEPERGAIEVEIWDDAPSEAPEPPSSPAPMPPPTEVWGGANLPSLGSSLLKRTHFGMPEASSVGDDDPCEPAKQEPTLVEPQSAPRPAPEPTPAREPTPGPLSAASPPIEPPTIDPATAQTRTPPLSPIESPPPAADAEPAPQATEIEAPRPPPSRVGQLALRPVPQLKRRQAEPSIERTPSTAPESVSPLDPEGDRDTLAEPRALPFAVLLGELRACEDDRAYRGLVRNAQERASELAETGQLDEYYEAVFLIADHAAGGGGRSHVQQRCAEATLALLLSGDRLADLIERAASRETDSDLAAVRLIVQLGARTVPALIATLAAEREPEPAKRLEELFLTLDDHAIPALRSAMFEGKPSHRKLAVQLAARMRDPSLIPALMDLLGSESPELRRLAAQGLIEIGGRSCIRALVEALESPVEHLPELAAACLGEIGDRRSLKALLDHLDAAFRKGQTGLAREIIHALARLEDSRSVPALVSLVDRRGFFRRRMHRELRLEALTALSRMPGSEARRALFRALHSRDSAVREMAEQLVAAQREEEQRRAAPTR